MLKPIAALVVAFLTVSAFADHKELLCYKKEPHGTWRPYGGNPIGCWGEYPNTPAGAHRCQQDREYNLQYLEQTHPGEEFMCQCVTVGNPGGGGGGGEGW